jgi:hypothetical protein
MSLREMGLPGQKLELRFLREAVMSFLHSLIRSLWSRDNSAAPLDLGSRADRVLEHKRRVKKTEESAEDERFAQEAVEVKAQWDNKQYAVE